MDASQEEIEYKWFEAAKSYEQILQSISGVAPFAAESWQRIGFCYSLASRQTKDAEEFKKLRQLAAESYEKAARLFRFHSKYSSYKLLSFLYALAHFSESKLYFLYAAS
jgi:hypothetical protein